MRKNDGFTLLELITILAIIGLVAAFSLPDFMTWLRSAKYRENASNIHSAFNKARSFAIATNLEHRVEFDEFDLGGAKRYQYRITRGNLYSGSTAWTSVAGWSTLPAEVSLRSTDDCDVAGDINIPFHPNGSALDSATNLAYVCIMAADAGNARKYRIEVRSSTGRTKVEH